MDQNIVNKIETMIKNGFVKRKICKDLDLKNKEYDEIITQNNFKVELIDFQENMVPEIMKLYNEGVSASALCEKYQIDKKRVIKWAKQYGYFRDKNQANRIHSLNENIFDFIDSPNKAYWIGFCYGKAYNNLDNYSITIDVKEKDKEQLVSFANFLGMDLDIIKEKEIFLEETQTSYKHNYITIYSKKLSERLNVLGCVQNKSFILTYPKWLNSNYNYHFIRGYFDGYGNLYKNENTNEWNWKLKGTKEICNSIIDLFKIDNLDLNHMSYVGKNDTNVYEIKISGNLKIDKICELLYNKSNTFMERKHNRYLDLIIQNEETHKKDK